MKFSHTTVIQGYFRYIYRVLQKCSKLVCFQLFFYSVALHLQVLCSERVCQSTKRHRHRQLIKAAQGIVRQTTDRENQFGPHLLYKVLFGDLYLFQYHSSWDFNRNEKSLLTIQVVLNGKGEWDHHFSETNCQNLTNERSLIFPPFSSLLGIIYSRFTLKIQSENIIKLCFYSSWNLKDNTHRNC